MNTGIPTDRAVLSEELINDRTDERREISRLIHDSISQDLVALSFSLSSLSPEPAGRTGAGTPATYIPDLIERCCRDIRVLSCMLTPPQRGHEGLAWTIESYAGWLRHEAGLTINVSCDPAAEQVSPDAESLMLAAIQEWTIRTLLKRVNASLFIRLGRGHRAVVLELQSVAEIEVAGINGMKPMTEGWAAIRERAEALGGSFEMSSDPGGALARMSLPESGPV